MPKVRTKHVSKSDLKSLRAAKLQETRALAAEFNLTILQFLSVRGATFRRYHNIMLNFKVWMASEHISLPVFAQTWTAAEQSLLDPTLARYLDFLFLDGESMYVGSAVLASMTYFHRGKLWFAAGRL